MRPAHRGGPCGEVDDDPCRGVGEAELVQAAIGAVGARPNVQQVSPRPADDYVAVLVLVVEQAVGLPVDPVVAWPALQAVGAAPPADEVGASAAVDVVPTLADRDHVAAGGADHVVTAVSADDGRGNALASGHRCACGGGWGGDRDGGEEQHGDGHGSAHVEPLSRCRQPALATARRTGSSRCASATDGHVVGGLHHGRVLHSARARRLPRRLGQLYVGLMLYGVSMALLVRSSLGVMPWDVLHQGLARQLDWSLGAVTIVVGIVVLLGWVPLRERPGLGTVSNVVVIGLAVDAALTALPAPSALPTQLAMAAAGILLNGVATAAYIGVHLGAGPRDGLMTGLVRRTGGSVRLVRTTIEVVVVAVGWLLGGTLGVVTVLYAMAIGPLVHALLPRLAVTLPEPG